jgi:SAM-dependent methyltransferase
MAKTAKLPSAEEAPDIRAIMERIRERIAADVESHRDHYPIRPPTTAGDGAYRQGGLQHSEELSFLNRHYAYELKLSPDAITTHRAGLIGKLIVKGKRRLVAFLREAILRDYLASERTFQENLVRFLNEVGRYIDARDDAVTKGIGRQIERISDDTTSAVTALNHRTGVSFSDLIGRLDTLDGMVRGIEGLVNNLETYRNPNPPTAEGEAKPPTQPAADLSYVLLENRYRGSEEEIARRLEIYPEIFKAAPGTILEIGSGRGELQRLFKERSLSSYGVDLDPAMVNVATSRGLNTLHGDGIAHLRSLEDRSLGGLVAIQVVEHLTRDQLHELFTLVKTKLRPGARAVFETINPQSLLALSSNYFRDPTHVWPLHPDTLGYMATLAGLAIVETRYLSPVSPNQLLLPIPVDTALKPNVAEAIRRVNMNIEQLNKILYGFQDYCLVVEVA